MNPILSGLVFILVALVGWFAGRYEIITDDGRSHLTKVLFYILLPALVGGGVMKSPLEKDTLYIFFLAIFMSLAIWYILLRIFMLFYDKKTASLLAMVTTMGNTGFLGFPLVDRMIGENAMPYAVAFSIGQSIVLMAAVYPSLGGQFSWKKLLSPPMIGMLVGFVLRGVSPIIPHGMWQVLVDTFSMLGDASGPLVMLIIGSSLKAIQFKTYDIYIILLKLVVMPAIFYIVLVKLVSPVPLKAAVLEASTPTLMAAPIWAGMAGLSEEEAARIVAVVTGVFLLALPLIGWLLG